jgi:hypothetical protein
MPSPPRCTKGIHGISGGISCQIRLKAFMNLGLVVAALEDQSEESVSALLEDDQTVFWVD